jgi:hypothetical protein
MKAVAGIVTIQAKTMLLATLQRTDDTRRAAPTPMMQPVMVCVVETGMPRCVAVNSVMAPPVSAQNPWNGVSDRDQDQRDQQRQRERDRVHRGNHTFSSMMPWISLPTSSKRSTTFSRWS